MTEKELISLAKKAAENAYVPYSGYTVGAALVGKAERFISAATLKTPPTVPQTVQKELPFSRPSVRVNVNLQ